MLRKRRVYLLARAAVRKPMLMMISMESSCDAAEAEGLFTSEVLMMIYLEIACDACSSTPV